MKIAAKEKIGSGEVSGTSQNEQFGANIQDAPIKDPINDEGKIYLPKSIDKTDVLDVIADAGEFVLRDRDQRNSLVYSDGKGNIWLGFGAGERNFTQEESVQMYQACLMVEPEDIPEVIKKLLKEAGKIQEKGNHIYCKALLAAPGKKISEGVIKEPEKDDNLGDFLGLMEDQPRIILYSDKGGHYISDLLKSLINDPELDWNKVEKRRRDRFGGAQFVKNAPGGYPFHIVGGDKNEIIYSVNRFAESKIPDRFMCQNVIIEPR